MGSLGSEGLTATERQVQRLTLIVQAFICGYILIYVIFYRNHHLKLEPVTGNVHVDVWGGAHGHTQADFEQLAYCEGHGASVGVQAGTCLVSRRKTSLLDDSWNHIGTLSPGQSVLAAGPPKDFGGVLRVPVQSGGIVDLQDMRRCSHQAGSAPELHRCGFVNEVDLLQMDGGRFVPTFVQVVHQKASCADGSSYLDTCQLDYRATPENQQVIDEFYIGYIERYKVQFTHAFQSDIIGQMTLDEASHLDMPECGGAAFGGPPAICYDRTGGGHDETTIAGLLSLAGLTLDSNNMETNHPGNLEAFRTSGMKLHVSVQYSNVESFWSWAGLGTIGYRYHVDVMPAQSVWRSIILKPESYRAWVNAGDIVGIGKCDRLVIWADGIEISGRVAGHLGHLDITNLLLVLSASIPLLWLASNIVRCLLLRTTSGKYETMGFDDERDGLKGRGAGAALSGEDSGGHPGDSP